MCNRIRDKEIPTSSYNDDNPPTPQSNTTANVEKTVDENDPSMAFNLSSSSSQLEKIANVEKTVDENDPSVAFNLLNQSNSLDIGITGKKNIKDVTEERSNKAISLCGIILNTADELNHNDKNNGNQGFEQKHVSRRSFESTTGTGFNQSIDNSSTIDDNSNMHFEEEESEDNEEYSFDLGCFSNRFNKSQERITGSGNVLDLACFSSPKMKSPSSSLPLDSSLSFPVGDSTENIERQSTVVNASIKPIEIFADTSVSTVNKKQMGSLSDEVLISDNSSDSFKFSTSHGIAVHVKSDLTQNTYNPTISPDKVSNEEGNQSDSKNCFPNSPESPASSPLNYMYNNIDDYDSGENITDGFDSAKLTENSLSIKNNSILNKPDGIFMEHNVKPINIDCESEKKLHSYTQTKHSKKDALALVGLDNSSSDESESNLRPNRSRLSRSSQDRVKQVESLNTNRNIEHDFSPAPLSKGSDQWTCAACTYLNELCHDRCELCDSKRGKLSRSIKPPDRLDSWNITPQLDNEDNSDDNYVPVDFSSVKDLKNSDYSSAEDVAFNLNEDHIYSDVEAESDTYNDGDYVIQDKHLDELSKKLEEFSMYFTPVEILSATPGKCCVDYRNIFAGTKRRGTFEERLIKRKQDSANRIRKQKAGNHGGVIYTRTRKPPSAAKKKRKSASTSSKASSTKKTKNESQPTFQRASVPFNRQTHNNFVNHYANDGVDIGSMGYTTWEGQGSSSIAFE